jgi:SAM-dependent methyltransferase
MKQLVHECPVCSSKSRREMSLHDVHLYRCHVCDHCFTDVSSLRAEEQYSADYYEEKHRNWFENPNWPLFSHIERVISQHSRAASVLDVGCGRGDLLRFLRQRGAGFSLTGIDLSDVPSDPSIELIKGDFFTWRDERSFDAVVSLATIEHVSDVRGFVQGLIRRTKPGGLILVMTLNERSVLYAVARAMGRVGLVTPAVRLYDRHHLNHFSGTSLRRLMEVSGLNVQEVNNHNAPMAAIDFEADSGPAAAIMRAGVWGTFALGTLTGRTYLQTVVARLPT